MTMTRFSIPAARTVGGGAVVFLMSISVNAVSRYGAQAEPRFQCPRGQIYRVTKHICVSKQSNLGYLPSTRKKDAIAASSGARRDVLGPVSPHSAPQISSVDGSSAAGEKPPVEEAITPRIQQSEPVTSSPHADLESNLGAVLQAPPERQSGTAKLEDLVAAYRDALKEFIRERAPLDWAMTQSDLGNALAILGEREGRTATLEESVAVYREALKEFTRERAPFQWATIQNNLGAALATIGEEGSGTLRLEE